VGWSFPEDSGAARRYPSPPALLPYRPFRLRLDGVGRGCLVFLAPAAEGAAVRDDRPEVPPILERAKEKKSRPGDHSDHRIFPRIPTRERSRHTEHPKPDQRFPASASLDAWPATTLVFHDDLVGRPCVEYKAKADQAGEHRGDKWEDFYWHQISTKKAIRSALGASG
jgi:hypothetical protein